MSHRQSMTRIYLLSMVLLAIVPAAVLGYLWVTEKFLDLEVQAEGWRETYVNTRRELLQQEVVRAVDYIDFKRSQSRRHLRGVLKIRVEEIGGFVDGFRRAAPATDDSALITQLIGGLEKLSFNGGQGAYYLGRMDGSTLMSPLGAELGGGDKQSLADAYGREIAEAFFADLAQHGEAYIELQPPLAVAGVQSMVGVSRPLIAYGKYYPPLDLLIAAVHYVDELDVAVQREVLERLTNVHYEVDKAVLLVAAQSGLLLSPPVAGAGLPEAMTTAEFWHSYRGTAAGGGFADYGWQRDDGSSTPAINYLQAYPDWGWVIAAGADLSDLEQALAAQRSQVERQVANNIRNILLTVLCLISVALLFARRMAAVSARGFGAFSDFFERAGRGDGHIDRQRLPYREFVDLAQHAELMVDERARHEQALRYSERRFAEALAAADSFSWQLDLESQQIYISEGFFGSLGLVRPGGEASEREPFGFDHLTAICHPDDLEMIQRSLQGDPAYTLRDGLEFRLRDSLGLYQWFFCRGDFSAPQVLSTSVADPATVSRPSRTVLGIVSNISQQKNMEQQLLAAGIVAEDARHVRAQFLASMNHELRTPLNGILGHCQILLRESELAQPLRQPLQQIELCGRQLLELVDDILSLSTIDSAPVELQLEQISLRELAQHVSDRMRRKAEEKGLTFRLRLADQLPATLSIDRLKVEQILVNLVTNAIKFTNSGFVELAIESPESKRLQLSVSDSGIGIAEEMQQDIFQPFLQVSGLKTAGSGLGLSICKRLADAMGAELSLHSELGSGSCFCLSLRQAEFDGSDTVTTAQAANPSLECEASVAAVSLPAAQHRQLSAACRVGDVEALRQLLNGLQRELPAAADWLQRCQNLLDSFDLQGVARLLEATEIEGSVLTEAGVEGEGV